MDSRKLNRWCIRFILELRNR